MGLKQLYELRVKSHYIPTFVGMTVFLKTRINITWITRYID